MITALHVATGAVAGSLAGSRRGAAVLGAAMHVAGDRMPHWDNASRRYEVVSGVGCLLLIAATRGPFDRATIGALAGSAPDVEHLIRLPRPGGRKLFPSHRIHGWHRAGGVPAWLQGLVAGVLVGVLARRR